MLSNRSENLGCEDTPVQHPAVLALAALLCARIALDIKALTATALSATSQIGKGPQSQEADHGGQLACVRSLLLNETLANAVARQGGLKARHPSWEPVPWPIETHLICGHKARVLCASEESPVGSDLVSMFGTCKQACFCNWARVILNTVLVNRQHALQQVTVERRMLPSTRNPKSTPQRGLPPSLPACPVLQRSSRYTPSQGSLGSCLAT